MVSSRDFASLMAGPLPAQDSEKPEPRPEEADYWMDRFGFNDEK